MRDSHQSTASITNCWTPDSLQAPVPEQLMMLKIKARPGNWQHYCLHSRGGE